MKICVLMFYNDEIEDYGIINYKINKLYCDKYNLDLILSNEVKYNDRNVCWEKYPLLLEHINNYDYLIWVDADAFFYYDSNNIVDIINENPTANFIFSKDNRSECDSISSGIIIVKNTSYSINLLNKIAYDDELFKNNPNPKWNDDGLLTYLVNSNMLDISNNSIICDYCILQHFSKLELSEFKNNSTPKPFIFHLTRKHNKAVRRIVSNNYYREISNDYQYAQL